MGMGICKVATYLWASSPSSEWDKLCKPSWGDLEVGL